MTLRCPSVGVPFLADCIRPGLTCASQYACESMRAKVVGLLGTAYHERVVHVCDWNAACSEGNPARCAQVRAHSKFVSEEQKAAGVPVKQVPLLLRLAIAVYS